METKNRWKCPEHGVFTSGTDAGWACPLCSRPGALLGRDEPHQGTRLLTVTCLDCGYRARTTRKWLDLLGAPLCPCNAEAMALVTKVEAEAEGPAE